MSAAIALAVALANLFQPSSIVIEWEVCGMATNHWFRVYQTTDLVNWALIAEVTNAQALRIPLTNDYAFFGVTVTDGISESAMWRREPCE